MHLAEYITDTAQIGGVSSITVDFRKST